MTSQPSANSLPSPVPAKFDPDNTWVLLWSQQQGLWHKETLTEMFQSHWSAFHENRELQYIPLAMGAASAIDQISAHFAATIAERYDAAHKDDDPFIPYAQLP